MVHWLLGFWQREKGPVIEVSSSSPVSAGNAGGPQQSQEIPSYLFVDTPTTTRKPWEFEHTSKWLRKWMWVAIAVIMVIHCFMAVVVAIGDTGAAVTPVDQWAFVGIGLLASCVCLLALRPRVRANADGVQVRNFLGTRFYPWQVVYGLAFPKSDRYARLELPEFEYVPMWAFQAGDGRAVVDAVGKFRELEDKYMPED